MLRLMLLLLLLLMLILVHLLLLLLMLLRPTTDHCSQVLSDFGGDASGRGGSRSEGRRCRG